MALGNQGQIGPARAPTSGMLRLSTLQQNKNEPYPVQALVVGGGGGANGGAGGNGGGGSGTSTIGNNGTVNTGGGGGGSAVSFATGNGGSGVVILSIPTLFYTGTTTGSPTVTSSGADKILTFTGSGSYTA